jgi:transposase
LHVAKDLVIPDGIQLEFLPAYSPELQPAEHLWPPLREAVANQVANQYVETRDDLDRILGERCCTLADDPVRISASTRFPWWPAFA